MIWGFTGMILAITLDELTVIVCSQIPSARFIAVFLSEKGDIGDLEG